MRVKMSPSQTARAYRRVLVRRVQSTWAVVLLDVDPYRAAWWIERVLAIASTEGGAERAARELAENPLNLPSLPAQVSDGSPAPSAGMRGEVLTRPILDGRFDGSEPRVVTGSDGGERRDSAGAVAGAAQGKTATRRRRAIAR